MSDSDTTAKPAGETRDLIILGGGVSKKHKKWFKYLRTDARVVPAKMRNDAGIVGAALAAAAARKKK